MSEILEIANNKVKIGKDDDTIVTVPISAIKFENPKVGDKVKVYKDGKSYFVSKATSSFNSEDLIGDHRINKHLFVWAFAFFLGGFGVDRFMRGQIGIGVCKLFLGWLTLGIWPLVDFIIALTNSLNLTNKGTTLNNLAPTTKTTWVYQVVFYFNGNLAEGGRFELPLQVTPY